MEMTYDNYISNPMGIKNAVFSNREMYRNLYKTKLDNILLRELGKVKYKLYHDKENYYVYMKIPSEVVPKFYYDVVVQFYTNDKIKKISRTIIDYNVKFFSNDPSFVFTFAHSFLNNQIFIKDLVPRMSRQAVLKVAKEKNPSNQVGYVKSLYFTYLLMKQYGLFNKVKFEAEGLPYNKKELLSEIMPSDEKIKLRQEKGTEVAKEKRNNKIKQQRTNQATNNSGLNNISKNNMSSVTTTRNTKSISSISRSKITKRTKKI